jgi:RNA polymerase sigma factor (sigma-70 family)
MADEDVAPPPLDCRTHIMPRTDTPTNVAIIEGVQGPRQDRWAEFYVIYKPMLVGYFRKQGLPDGDVQDLVQDVFLKLCRSIRSYNRGRTRFRTWLFTVARNTMIDYIRDKKTQGRALEAWTTRILAESAGDEDRQRQDFEREHHARILQYAFEKARLRSKERVWNCFEMSVIQGKSGAEVAEALGVTPNVVYVNSWRVLQYVKDFCQRYGEDLKHEPDERLP